jgi:hypothetical protein
VYRAFELVLAGEEGEVFNAGEPVTRPIIAWVRQTLDATGHEGLTRARSLRCGAGGSLADPRAAAAPAARQLEDHPGLDWRRAPAEEPVAGSVRWHLEHPPAEPDAGFAAAAEALAQPK